MDRANLANYRERLLASGARITKQRALVLEALASGSGHTTAADVLSAVQSRYPKVNKTTVYRTLDLLVDLGVVAMTHMGGNQYMYEVVGSPHHHLICKECGTVIELPDTTLNPLRQVIESEHSFRPCFDHFALFGVCAACQSGDE